MVDVKQLLLDTLEPYGYPIFLQGSMSDSDAYPDHFFTFFNNTTNDAAFYGNDEHLLIWDFDLNFYSIDPALTNTMLRTLKKPLKNVGFIMEGVGYDVMSDEPTHTGRGVNLTFIEEEIQ